MAIIATTRTRSSAPAVLAQLFGILAVILMLVWVFHYRGGINIDSSNLEHIFNVHPFLAFIGFIYVSGQALMIYRSFPASHRSQKIAHSLLNLIAVIMGIIAISAVFKFHNLGQIPDMYSLHSWFGITTICLFCLQWLFGFLAFWFPGGGRTARASLVPMHAMSGVFIFFMAICTAETGLMEKFTFSRLTYGHEAKVMNFTGLMIFLYGVFVILTTISII